MKKVFVIVFVGLLLCFSIYNLIVPAREFLPNENRYAATAPEFSPDAFLSGEYSEDLEKYITDKVAFREFFISLKSNSEKLLGKYENNGVYFCDDGYLIETASNTSDINILDKNIKAINDLAKVENLNVNFALIPTAYEILKEKLPPYAYSNYRQEAFSYVKSNLDNVNFIDTVKTLEENKDEYIYYRTDHHQTMHGSYLVYKDIMTSMGIIPHDKEEFEITTVSDSFFGTTWSKATVNVQGDSIIKYQPKADIIYSVDYDGVKHTDTLYTEDNLKIKDKYTYYLDGNHGITEIKTNVKNGKKLAVIKDSYAHSILPLIADHYEEIAVFDLRYYNLSIPSYLSENSINDVLFIYNTANFLTDNNLVKISAYLQSNL